jgi:polysaccharide biosynthesis protein PslF
VRESDGESYRESLVALVRRHGLEDVVEFDDRYIDRETLAQLVRSADLVILPYESVEQLTSGVLVEAIAASKPVIATEFPHAVELLSGGAGVVVPHGDTAALSAAVHRVITDGAARSTMALGARRLADGWYWPTIGGRFGAMMTKMALDHRTIPAPAALEVRHAVA